MAKKESKYLRRVVLSADVYGICLQHAISTETEEIMGLLIGEVDDLHVSHISGCIILHRSDKQPDRVEISPEQLCTASAVADELSEKLNRPMRVLGWYHSHPRITIWPSHVDIQTQTMYQTMDPLFVGLIFSVFQNNKGLPISNKLQLICFQAEGGERREVPFVIKNSPLQYHNVEAITKLPVILAQEEVTKHDEDTNGCIDPLSELHNRAFKTLKLIHVISKVSLPLYDNLEQRLNATNLRIQELENVKGELLKKLAP